MIKSHSFTFWSGALTADHRKKIGPAIWEFLWCIDKTTKEITEDGRNWGLVYSGKPVTCEVIAQEYGINERTIRRNLERLETEGYIKIIRAPYGLIIHVCIG